MQPKIKRPPIRSLKLFFSHFSSSTLSVRARGESKTATGGLIRPAEAQQVRAATNQAEISWKVNGNRLRAISFLETAAAQAEKPSLLASIFSHISIKETLAQAELNWLPRLTA